MGEVGEALSVQGLNKKLIFSSWQDLAASYPGRGIAEVKCGDGTLVFNERRNLFGKTFLVARTDVKVGDEVVSTRDYHFNGSDIPGIVVVTDNSVTFPGYESKGFGTALIHLTPDVIEKVMHDHPQEFDGKAAVLIAFDRAKPQKEDKSREGWSSIQLENIGCNFYAPGGFWWHKYGAGLENGVSEEILKTLSIVYSPPAENGRGK